MKSQSMLIVFAVAAGLFATGNQATAGECYGSFVLRNSSSVPIHYQVKWGDGEWTSYCVPAGWSKYHSYPLDGNGCVPTPNVRFDHIAGDNQTDHKCYKVDVYATHCPEQGKKHVFRYSHCGCYLDLYGE